MSTEANSAIGAEAKEISAVIDDIGFGRFQIILIILCGLIQAADKMQIQYVSLIGEQLQCVWQISDFWKAAITSATFLGMLVAAYIWGPLGDKFCRRSVDAVCMGYVAVYGCLTALAPNVIWVVLLRFLVGFGFGGVQALTETTLGEFVTTNRRGVAWFVFQSLWCVGGLIEIGLAWLLLQSTPHSWRYLAVATSLPMFLLCLIWILWLPISPRQSLLQGCIAEARQSLNKMADTNSKPRYLGEFTEKDLRPNEKRGSILELFRPDTFLRLSLQMAIIGFAAQFSYYGMILLNVQVPLLLREQCQGAGNETAEVYFEKQAFDCHKCESIDYVEILIPTLADFATALINGFVLERIFGRRLNMVIAFGVSSILFPLLGVCMHIVLRICLFFVIRFFASTCATVFGLYVLEAYPTSLRSTALALLISFSRISSLLMPFVAQMFMARVSLLGGLFIFSGLMALGAISAVLLPLETKDRLLKQTANGEKGDADPSDEMQLMKTEVNEATQPHQDYGSVGVSTKTE